MIYTKDFDGWNTRKQNINNTLLSSPYFKERDVWWLAIGINIGYEEDGKSRAFSRPVLIIKKFNSNLFLGIPLSTKVKSSPYYVTIRFKDRSVSAMISQIRAFSSKRLLGKMGILENPSYQRIMQEISENIFSPFTNGLL